MPPILNVALDILLTVAMLAVMVLVYRRGKAGAARLRGRRHIEDE